MIYDNPEARAGAAPEFDEHEDQYFTVKCLRGPFSDNLLIAGSVYTRRQAMVDFLDDHPGVKGKARDLLQPKSTNGSS